MPTKTCPGRAEAIAQGIASWGADALRLKDNPSKAAIKKVNHVIAAANTAKDERYCIGSPCQAWKTTGGPHIGFCRRFGEPEDGRADPAK